MIYKSSLIYIYVLLILKISNTIEVKAGNVNINNNLLNSFCMATLKSKIDKKNKENFEEIGRYTCGCFFKKYKSGYSIKRSRIYCKEKAAEKYNL